MKNEPKLRFKEFSDEWEEKSVGDLGSVVTGTTPSTKNKGNYRNGKYLWVTPTDIGFSKIITATERRLSDEGLKHGRFIPKNSVLVTCIASIGKNCVLKEDGSCNQQVNAITPNKSFDLDFIYYNIEKSSEKLKQLACTTATPI